MSFIDEVIAARLKKLRSDMTGGDIKTNVNLIEKSKTEVQQVDDLLSQVTEETKLDISIKKDIDDEIRNRLDRLKESTINLLSSEKRGNQTLPDIVEDIVSKFKNLAEIESRMDVDASSLTLPSVASDSQSDDNINKSADELPWCEICNEDASIRCTGCDNDLYCSKCYNEFHDSEDFKSHKKVPYDPNKTE